MATSTTSTPNAKGATKPKPTDGFSSAKSQQYYGPMFDRDKKPTRTLDGILKAMGRYIMDNVGDKHVNLITPQKLAQVYKPFPSDIDGFLLESSPKDLSNIWAVMGYEHHLVQPNYDRYARPSIPALTLQGFCRWMAVQLLVDPAGNVPFLCFAVQAWKLRDPETGEAFPPNVPATAFPTEPDRKTEQWEEDCGKKLLAQVQAQQESTGRNKNGNTSSSKKPSATAFADDYYSDGWRPPRTRVSPDPMRFATEPRLYEYVRRRADETVYTTRVPFTPIPGAQARYRHSPEQSTEREREGEREIARDRAYSLDPRSPIPPHRHSNPYPNPTPRVRDVLPRNPGRRRSFTDYHNHNRHQHHQQGHHPVYAPQSASDPHLKSSQKSPPTTMPQVPAPPSATAPGSAPTPVPPGPIPHIRRAPPPDLSSASSASDTDTDYASEISGSSSDESPRGTSSRRRRRTGSHARDQISSSTMPPRRSPRRRPRRPVSRDNNAASKATTTKTTTTTPSYRDPTPSAESSFSASAATAAAAGLAVGVAASAGATATIAMASPRLRPAPPAHHGGGGNSSGNGATSEVIKPVPVGGILKPSPSPSPAAQPSEALRRPHSHDSRYQPVRMPIRYSDDDDDDDDDERGGAYSIEEEEELGPSRLRRQQQQRRRKDVPPQAAARGKGTTERRRDRERGRDRDRSRGSYDRELKHEREREWERDREERLGSQLRRPERHHHHHHHHRPSPPAEMRRASSHADVDRRLREREVAAGEYYERYGRSRGHSPATPRRLVVTADGRLV